jgi:hypothetical protein
VAEAKSCWCEARRLHPSTATRSSEEEEEEEEEDDKRGIVF